GKLEVDRAAVGRGQIGANRGRSAKREAQSLGQRGFLVGAGVAAGDEQQVGDAAVDIGRDLTEARTSVVGIAVGNLRRILSVGAFGLVNVEEKPTLVH